MTALTEAESAEADTAYLLRAVYLQALEQMGEAKAEVRAEAAS